MKILSIGSGTERFSSDVITLDISADAGPDVVWDLNKGPYPFEDGFFDEIHAKDVIEHVNDIIFVMNECHRILKKNGVLKIHTPHFSSADSYTDPTHRQHLSIFSFDFFSKNHLRAYYSKGAFEIILKKIFFKGDSFFIKMIEKFANKWPFLYEQRFAWIFQAGWIYVEMRKVD